MIKSFERKNLVEEITTQLRENILSGEWPAGSLIPSEPELSKAFNVSRNTVRSAIQELCAYGILVKKQGVGTSVAENLTENLLATSIPHFLFSKKELIDVLEFRRVIEIESVVLACKRATSADIADLRSCANKLRQSEDDPNEFIHADYAIHIRLAEASRNGMFLRVMLQLKEVILQYMQEAVNLTDIETSYQRHLKIIDAIEERKARTARNIMADHFDVLIEYLDKETASLYDDV